LDDPFSTIKLRNFRSMHYDKEITKKSDITFFDSKTCLDVVATRTAFQERFTKIISDPELQNTLQTYFNQHKITPISVKVPQITHITPASETIHHVIDKIKSAGMQFPMIVKTTSATLLEISHFMGVALDYEGLKEIESHRFFRKQDHIIQELINHDERINKIYVLGENLILMQKQSIPNIKMEDLGVNHFFFDSQKSFSEVEALKSKLKYSELPIARGIVEILTKSISESLEASMYGLDIVRQSETGDYYLIDINYFPGYKNVNNFTELIREWIIKKIEARGVEKNSISM